MIRCTQWTNYHAIFFTSDPNILLLIRGNETEIELLQESNLKSYDNVKFWLYGTIRIK